MNLEERRRATEEKLVGLYADRGRAVVAGLAFDPAEIAVAEAELAGFADAQSEQHRQSAVEAEEAERDRCDKLRDVVAEQEQLRLAAIDRFEAATGEMAAAIGEIECATDTEQKALRALRQHVGPLTSQRERLSASAARILLGRRGDREWGSLSWCDPGSLGLREGRSWASQLAVDMTRIGDPK